MPAHRGSIDSGDFRHTLYGHDSVGQGVESDICHQVADQATSALPVEDDLNFFAAENEPLVEEREIVNVHHKSIVIDPTPLSYKDELKTLSTLAWPVVLTFMLELSPPLVTSIFVGHLPKKEYLDGAAIGAMFMNVSGFSIGFGLTSAMDTLCAQAFGAGHGGQIGLWVQRALLILAVVTIPISYVNWYAAIPLKWAGQPEEVADLAQEFCRYTLPSIPFSFIYEVQKKALQAKGVVQPSLYCAIVQNVVNCALGYYFVYHTSLGFQGAALGRGISSIFLWLSLQIYIYWSGVMHDIWPEEGWTRACLRNWGTFLKLGIPGMLMMCLEWWAWEFLALLAGILPDSVVVIGANAILLNIATMSFMFYLGISVATSIHVANLLGAGKPGRARRAARTGWAISVVCSVVNATVLAAARHHLPYIFTADSEVARATASVLPVMAGYQIADGQMALFSGIFRGTGYQTYGAVLSFVAYYVIGLPLSAVFTLVWHYGVLGLWAGPTIALFICAFTGAALVIYMRWDRLSRTAIIRARAESKVFRSLASLDQLPNTPTRRTSSQVYNTF